MTVIQKAIEDFFIYRKFGIFAHWGLYSLLGGVWKGRPTPYIGEWIMRRCRIPVVEYQALSCQFNPVHFDADRWIGAVERAGAKYFVFTAKHHDGFAMYHSKVDKYNIIDASKYHTDPVAALAKACEKRGIKFCLYYSQDQDWHHPHGSGNDWDYDESQKDFSLFFNEKVKPQVTELLTQYGPIGLIWFDTPATITKPHSQELFDLVHRLQPACLVNGRLGHGVGDYAQTEDNDMPAGPTESVWEIPATMNDTWGYKAFDANWKSSRLLIRQLIEAVSKGGNYLLNVGPDADGAIPSESITRIEEIGNWLKVHQQAIFGVNPSPFLTEFPWGYVTKNHNKLYLHITEPKGNTIEMTGLRSPVKSIFVLGDSSASVPFSQVCGDRGGVYELSCQIPQLPKSANPCVLVVNVGGVIDVDTSIAQTPDGQIVLEAFRGQIHNPDGRATLKLGKHSAMQDWLTPNGSIEWTFCVHKPGRFAVSILTAAQRADGDPATPIEWDGDHHLQIRVADAQITGTITREFVSAPEGAYAEYVGSRLGHVVIETPGQYKLLVTPQKINAEKGMGLTLRAVQLSPVKTSIHRIETLHSRNDAETYAKVI